MPVPRMAKEPKYPSLQHLTNNFGRIPKEQNEFLASLGAPHVDSFDFAVGKGLKKAVDDLDPVEFVLLNGDRVKVFIENVEVLKPVADQVRVVYPTEARQSATSYCGRLIARFAWKVNDEQFPSADKDFGDIPIMVKSSKCNLRGLTPQQLVEKGEHPEEWGGYFIIQGHERLIRMLIMTRRNYPLSMKRPTWKTRGTMFSDLGILIRCVQEDQTSCNNVLHYITGGTAKLMLMLKRNQYFIPLVLIMKALVDVTDLYILKQLMAGHEGDLYFKGCIMSMLQIPHRDQLHTHWQIRNYMGQHFRVKLPELPVHWTDAQFCDYVLKRCVLIHLKTPEDKFRLLVFMTQKLWSLVQGRCSIDGTDSVNTQEMSVGGYLWLQYLKDRLQHSLLTTRMLLLRESSSANISPSLLGSVLKKLGSIGRHVNHFLGTGNIRSLSGLGLMQDSGLTITAENINRMRYMSHFRAVHRGSFFQEMRTTEARQLLPDAWGFICPVHTPDGAPCGLLNHLTKYCTVTPIPDDKIVTGMPALLVTLGMMPVDSVVVIGVSLKEYYVVMLDGCVIGYLSDNLVKLCIDELRLLKIAGKVVPETLEIGFIPKQSSKGSQYPGLFLFTGPARMMRPVVNLAAQRMELIGSMEQLYMDICVTPQEAYENVTTHQELSDTSFLSNLACLIPMPDCNQSPRNMYQCQMGKQTMGTASYTLQKQTEAKMYRLQTPAAPLFKPAHYDYIELDNYAMGTNALVAVISYTGYDMEDAMVINKSSYDRGFAHGSVYKTETIVLPSKNSYFGLGKDESLLEHLDGDGLPRVGDKLSASKPMCSYYDDTLGHYVVNKWKSTEEAYIDGVRLCSNMSVVNRKGVCITIRIPRNPSIGDKFASRAGQKGICSMLWPAEDLPFTEEGLVPDIVFNPHGFPSRMTIAMMIEVMAGKSAATHGLVHDATPFRFDEDNTAIDYFGKLLEAGGYNYYGTEKMYSGTDGREMKADIFFGIVHYQRLRHMVADKWQVRSTGPVDVLTQQPVKGRRRGGGVRFGEMERDSLLSHGAAFLLQDRLVHCSDVCTTFICRACGNILSPVFQATGHGKQRKLYCRLCKGTGQVEEIDLPYIYRFLVMQLASVNINLRLQVSKN